MATVSVLIKRKSAQKNVVAKENVYVANVRLHVQVTAVAIKQIVDVTAIVNAYVLINIIAEGKQMYYTDLYFKFIYLFLLSE